MRRWCVQFWDFGHWHEWATGDAGSQYTGFAYRQHAVDEAQKLNRGTSHIDRMTTFEGHRFRVRKVEI